jgi:hypothetical protein
MNRTKLWAVLGMACFLTLVIVFVALLASHGPALSAMAGASPLFVLFLFGMAITADPDAHVSGKDGDLAFEQYLDLLDMNAPEDTPFYSSIGRSPRGRNAEGVELDMANHQLAWGLDLAPTPIGAVGWGDNYAIQSTEFINVLTNQRKMGNVGQAFRRASGAGWIADAVINTPGGRLIARARNKVNIAIKQDIEVALCSLDQIAVAPTTSGSATGGNMAGFRMLVDRANRYTDAATGFAYGKPTDIHFAPTAACFTGALSSTLTFANISTAMRALREAGGEHNDFVFLAGLDVRDAITQFVNPQTTSATGGALASTALRAFIRDQSDQTYGFSIGILKTDYGRVEVMESERIGDTLNAAADSGSTAVRTDRVFNKRQKSFLLYRPQDWHVHWGVRFEAGDIPDTGQGKSFFVRSYLSLRTRNPIRAGFGDMT